MEDGKVEACFESQAELLTHTAPIHTTADAKSAQEDPRGTFWASECRISSRKAFWTPSIRSGPAALHNLSFLAAEF